MPKKAIDVPSQEILAASFQYDPESGFLFRGGRRVGAKTNSSGYACVSFKGRTYLLHRLIWQVAYGDVNGRQVDHINGTKTDNRLENLRSASDRTNSWNKGIRKSKAVPFKGVTVGDRTGKYRAKIFVNGRLHSLGTFDTAEEASEAYRSAAVRKCGFYANGGEFLSKRGSVHAVAQAFERWRAAARVSG